VAVSSQKSHGFVQPVTGIALAVVRVRRFALARRPQVVDRCIQCLQQLIQGQVGQWRYLIGVQPATGFAKVAGQTLAVVCIEATAEVAIREIDFALDNPAWVIEQRNDVSGNRASILAR
jgi:hypothetical protein